MPNFYGSKVRFDGLGNIIVNGASRQAALRFQAEHTGLLEYIIIFLLWHPPENPGDVPYGAGDGGDCLVSLQTDDGTADHFPSGVELGSYQITAVSDPSSYPGRTSSNGFASFPRLPLSPVPTLVEGELYHLVVRNTHPDPDNNYFSIDGISLSRNVNLARLQRYVSNEDLAMLFNGGGGWENHINVRDTWSFQPIFEVRYRDGSRQGQGYMETPGNSITKFYGSRIIRQTITSTKTRRVTSVHVYLYGQTGSPGPLRFSVGNHIYDIPADDIADGPDWMDYTFASPIDLPVGQASDLQLTNPSGNASNAYIIRPMKQGGFYGLTAGLFDDGAADYSVNNGATWQIFPSGEGERYDLQFYFEEEVPGVIYIPTVLTVVTPTGPTLVSIEGLPSSAVRRPGETLDCAVRCHYSDGSVTDGSELTLVWSSTNPAVASVASTGVATAVGVGTTNIEARV